MPVSRRTLENMYAAMRAISAWIDHHREQERTLIPPYGTVGVGGADFDHLLAATVGEAYLRVLRRGGGASVARAEAAQAGDECVRIWNSRTCKGRACINGRHEQERWDEAGRAVADSVHLRYLRLTTPVEG